MELEVINKVRHYTCLDNSIFNLCDEVNNITYVIQLGKAHKYAIIIGILSAVSLVSICSFLFFLRRKKTKESKQEDAKADSRVQSANKITLQQYLQNQDIEGQTDFILDLHGSRYILTNVLIAILQYPFSLKD